MGRSPRAFVTLKPEGSATAEEIIAAGDQIVKHALDPVHFDLRILAGLDAQIEVQRGRVVELDDEPGCGHLPDATGCR